MFEVQHKLIKWGFTFIRDTTPRRWMIGTRRFEKTLWFHSQGPACPIEITRTKGFTFIRDTTPRHWMIGTRRLEKTLWFHSQGPAYPIEITRTSIKIRQGENNKETVKV